MGVPLPFTVQGNEIILGDYTIRVHLKGARAVASAEVPDGTTVKEGMTSDFAPDAQEALALALAEAQPQRSPILGTPHHGCFLSASSR